MKNEQFIQLSLAERAEFLWNYGELIGEKVYYDCNITLFLLDSFYVEVFFNRVQGEIVSISLQENPQILYAYIKDLDLGELVN